MNKTMKTELNRNKFELNNGAGDNCMVLSIESLGLIK